MAARSKARKRALDVLFAADARDVDPLVILDDRLADRDAAPFGDFAESIVRGVVSHGRRIDDLITQHAIGWTLDRMPRVDRTILRIAVFELIYEVDVDSAVAIDEAIELAKMLSTDASPKFVNGVLAQVAAVVPQLRAAPAHRPVASGDDETRD